MADEFGGDIAAQALYLLGLIERHGWNIRHRSDGKAVIVYTWPKHASGHDAPTLIEALTAASRCPRCTNQQET